MLHRRRTMASCRWLCIAPQRTLAGCGYTLELSRDPRFPEVPTAPGFPLQPSCITACSSAYVCGTGYALPIRPPGRPCPTFTRNQVTPAFPPMRRFTVAQRQFPCCPGSRWSLVAASGDVRSGRTGEFHPRAPGVAAPALFEACGFSVCSVEDWRSSTCRVGNPARPCGQCVCSWRSALSVRSLRRSVQTAAACARIALSCDVRLCPERYSYRPKNLEHQYVSLRSN